MSYHPRYSVFSPRMPVASVSCCSVYSAWTGRMVWGGADAHRQPAWPWAMMRRPPWTNGLAARRDGCVLIARLWAGASLLAAISIHLFFLNGPNLWTKPKQEFCFALYRIKNACGMDDWIEWYDISCGTYRWCSQNEPLSDLTLDIERLIDCQTSGRPAGISMWPCACHSDFEFVFVMT